MNLNRIKGLFKNFYFGVGMVECVNCMTKYVVFFKRWPDGHCRCGRKTWRIMGRLGWGK